MSISLDIEHLRTLVAIAESGGFTKAAAVRHISQPALSQHVRLLERTLKRRLFEKDGRTMRFTPDGERVLVEARKILATHDASLALLEVANPTTITVGCVEHAVEQMLPELLRTLTQAFPETGTRFEIGRSTQLYDSVAKGSVDLAFVLDPSGQAAGHEVGLLPLHWYAAPREPVAEETFSLVAFEEPCGLRERALALLAEAGHQVEVTATSTTLEGVLAGVRAGLGTALLPGIGGSPHGIQERPGLPAAGTAHLRMIARRGLDPEIEETALLAGRDFLAGTPNLRLISNA
ncbi:transcriptional regulator, LysR family [Nocardioidaceae bacterium Broad-1]|uniref:LysR family transcriptional regulator n=1 Tax=Nocardioides luteus TaxID=1844 RepID=UPI0002028386|nr:LysR family transcriptional regulator [Nocardioides luteus]EGD41833.1 transcriptional regulator, LysR family [Nocardioidaceae bacterium Broad-1]MBG6097016.1 DNA-binding transcriptional LysR family regulator [Nocardioides luteus]